jgi:competence protein ComEC
VSERVAALIERQRPNLALWVPVFFGLGIALYFALPVEPEGWALAAIGGASLALGATLLRVGPMARLLLLALLLPATGLATPALRARAVAAPVLP